MRGIASLLVLLAFLASPSRVSAQPAPEELAPYVGDWDRHGFYITVRDDGSSEVIWRVYQWCGPGVPEPCDSIVNNNRLVSGGRGEIAFGGVDADGAHGEVLWSTQPEFLVPGGVTLSLLPHGMAVLRQEHQELFLCSPNFTAESDAEMEERYAGCGA